MYNEQPISNVVIEDFIREFEQGMTVSFDLETSKQNELYDVAKAKGILVEGSRDLAIFKGIYTFADIADGNHKRIPKKELLARLPTLIGKPVTLDHVRRYVLGFVVDYRYVADKDEVIVYGVIFKQIFKAEWDKAVQLFKDKKLGLSSEIWAPKKDRKFLSDKTYEIHNFEFAGCTLVFINSVDKPAFADAMVLEVAKQQLEAEQELIFASLNKDNLNILHCDNCTGNAGHCNRCENLITSMAEPISAPATNPNKIKMVCGNCAHNFEYDFVQGTNSQIKCPNCLAVLDQSGKMIYPPQVRNFDVSCPDCQSRNNWLIIESTDNAATLRCLSCGKEYEVEFQDLNPELSALMNKITFLRSGSVSCLQCGTHNEYYAPSQQKDIGITCKKCGLQFSFDVSHDFKRDIKSINVKGIKKQDNSKDNKGGKNMYILEEAKLADDKELEVIEKDLLCSILEESKELTTEERNALEDKDYAVVITVKNKVDGSPRKIRKYPIKDAAHVRNALARIAQELAQEELHKLGVSVEATKRKIMAKAKEFGIDTSNGSLSKSCVNKLLRKAMLKVKGAKKEKEMVCSILEAKNKKFVAGIKKFYTKIREMKEAVNAKDLEVSKLQKEVADTKATYLETAKLIVSRRDELGKTAEGVSDEVIINDAEYELLKSKQINDNLPKAAGTKVGSAGINKDDAYYEKKRAEINGHAFKTPNK